MRQKMMAKRMTVVSLKRWCVHQGALRNLFKRAFTCQRLQLYTNQVPRRSMQRRPADGQTDRQTDVISALYSRYERHCWQMQYPNTF